MCLSGVGPVLPRMSELADFSCHPSAMGRWADDGWIFSVLLKC